jgi:hypothetical protein
LGAQHGIISAHRKKNLLHIDENIDIGICRRADQFLFRRKAEDEERVSAGLDKLALFPPNCFLHILCKAQLALTPH